MSAQEDVNSSENVATLYDKAKALYDEIETSNLDSNSEELQVMVEKCRCRLEHLTLLVSQLGVFSSNESIDELPSSSIKFLLLPALLGEITLKRKCLHISQHQMCNPTDRSSSHEHTNGNGHPKQELPDRHTILRLAKVYLKDFLIRCKQYDITTVELPKEELEPDKLQPQAAQGGRPTPQQLYAMGCEREKKVSRFKEKKLLEEKLKTLRSSLREADEETVREYYSSLVAHVIITSLDELDSIIMESRILQHMTARQPSQPPPTDKQQRSVPLQPFLITRDAAQKAVYGMGYPSLPVMSVDEFYDKRVKEGWFPPGSSSGGGGATVVSSDRSSVVAEHGTGEPPQDPRPDEEQNSDEEDSEDKRARLKDRDEYRDMHRRGWGNTYNRS